MGEAALRGGPEEEAMGKHAGVLEAGEDVLGDLRREPDGALVEGGVEGGDGGGGHDFADGLGWVRSFALWFCGEVLFEQR